MNQHIYNGWIILDKPVGISSAHAVAKVKRLLLTPAQAGAHMDPGLRRDLKVGHAGTLDPLASGVLPLALGEATKTVAYMMDAAKAYSFTVTWGEERDTDDREGQVTATSEKRPTEAEIQAILPKFTGIIRQAPPAYSAIKIEGKRAYDMARGGETVEMKVREVRVDSLRVDGGWWTVDSEKECSPSTIHHSPSTTSFLCHCGKGTYIRSLGRDMGRELGCLGYISRLRRLKVGKFNETHAISLEMLENMVHKGDLGFLHPVESALDDILARDIDASQAAQLRRGQRITLTQPTPDGLVMARHNDTLVAICELSQGTLKPVRVFNY